MDVAQAVLRTWLDIELFSPQSIPKLADSQASGQQIRNLVGHEDLTWLDLPSPGPGRAWRHQLFFGVFPLTDVFTQLDKIFAHTEELFDERPRGESAMAALVVDGAGGIIPSSTVLSSCAWGLGHARRSQRPNAVDFEEANSRLVEAMEQYCEDELRRTGGERLTVNAQHLSRLHALTAQHAGLSGDPLSSVIRVVSRTVSTKRVRNDDEEQVAVSDYLNSFYLKDLSQVLQKTGAQRGSDSGSALGRYLAGPTQTQRVDLRALGWTQTLANVGASCMTRGRWPSDPRNSMALSQQLAVNLALGTTALAHQPLTAVNGPPGTGKTTLLRDVLAELVVRRADAIAALRRPAEAFDSTPFTWESQDGYRRSVLPLSSQLTGFEMVVASNNNLAVQNLSDNLPLAASANGLPDATYFPAIARSLQLAYGKKEPQKSPSEPWGLIAGRLGKAVNRSNFRSALWFAKTDPQEPLHREGPANLQEWLKERHDNPQTLPWGECTARYREAAARVDRLLNEAQRAEQVLVSIGPLQARHRQQDQELQRTSNVVTECQNTVATQQGLSNGAERALADAKEVRDAHLRFRPGFWEWLSTWGKANKRWALEDQRLADAVQAARTAAEAAQTVLSEARHEAADAYRRHDQIQGLLKETKHNLDLAFESMRAGATRWGDAYPDASWWDSRIARETHAPWQTEELNAARNELFAAALTLHQDLLAHTARTWSKNLRAAMDVVSHPPSALASDALTAAWQCIFMVTPLVTTTFAAAGSCFAGLSPEALGWLLIDEAGQATPASAVGSIWRSRNVIAVGDPLQLEPINSLPREAERSIQEHYQAPEWALPTSTSVQQVADQSMPYGTAIARDSGDIWVGAPLVVHRRCEDPMFTISNTIAYDGMMVQATVPKDSTIPPTRWVDVEASSGQGHAIAAQITQAAAEVRTLLDSGVDPSDIIAIAPFKDLANALSQSLRRISSDISAGTVHTAQGREAAVVILVLGGDKARPGARQWAASKPNLLNVAASRAKQRLIVIGDRADWASLPQFSTLAELVPVTAPELSVRGLPQNENPAQ